MQRLLHVQVLLTEKLTKIFPCLNMIISEEQLNKACSILVFQLLKFTNQTKKAA